MTRKLAPRVRTLTPKMLQEIVNQLDSVRGSIQAVADYMNEPPKLKEVTFDGGAIADSAIERLTKFNGALATAAQVAKLKQPK